MKRCRRPRWSWTGFMGLRSPGLRRSSTQAGAQAPEGRTACGRAGCAQATLWPFHKPWADLSPAEREQLDRLFAQAPALKAVPTLREVLTLMFDPPFPRPRPRLP
jgi:hypothetical protein